MTDPKALTFEVVRDAAAQLKPVTQPHDRQARRGLRGVDQSVPEWERPSGTSQAASS